MSDGESEATGGHPRVTPNECQRIRDLRREGLMSAEIAEEVGRSKWAVTYHCNGRCSHGVEPINPATPYLSIGQEECEWIRDLRRDGLTIPEISDEVGVSQKRVHKHYRGVCDHHDGEDPLYAEVREHIAEQVDANGGEWITRAKYIPDETNASLEQISQFITRVHSGDDPELTAERWNGTSSPWVITRKESDSEDTDGYRSPITADECSRIRQLRKDGHSRADVASKVGCSGKTVTRHSTGECSHDVDRLNIQQFSKIDEEECSRIRQLREDGYTAQEVADEVGCGKRAVTRHSTGECSHESAQDAITTTVGLSDDECSAIREMYRSGTPYATIESETGHGRGTISKHVRGDCQHEAADENLIGDDVPKRVGSPVDKARCDEMRALRAEGLRTEEIAEHVDLSVSNTRKHIKGRCGHHDESDPVLASIREHIASKVRENGGKWISQAKEIAGEDELNATSNQVSIITRNANAGNDPLLEAERWGGSGSPWVFQHKAATDGGEE